MYCESCSATIPDDASTCPNCGVSMALFLQKKPVHTVTQTVPDFVKSPGSQPETTEAPAAVQATANAQPVGAYSNSATVNHAKEPINKTAVAGLVLGIISAVLAIFPYTYFLLFIGWGFFLFIIPLFGLAFSIIGLKDDNGRKSSKASAGIILSVVSSIFILCVFFFVFVPAMKKAQEMMEEWTAHARAMSPNGLLDTGYAYEENTGLDFSYDGYDIISLHIDSYDIAL